MGELAATFTFGRNALKRTAAASADEAMALMMAAQSGLNLSVLKSEDNGTYNRIRDLITFTGILQRDGAGAVVTEVGQAFVRMYNQNQEDSWRWLLTRSLWLYSVPNETDAAVNRIAKEKGVSFGFFQMVLGLLTHLAGLPGEDRFLYYDELCALLNDDAHWTLDSSSLFALVVERRKSGAIRSGRSLLGDLETEYGIPRDNFAALFNKAFHQTGIFDYLHSERKQVGIALSANFDRVLQGRVRFVLDNRRAWSEGEDWADYLGLRQPDLPEEVSLAATSEVEEETSPQAIDGMIAAAMIDLGEAGIQVEEEFLRRLVASLLAKRFVILTGLSGSGKTKVAQAIAAWLGSSNSLSRDPFEKGTELDADRITYRVLQSDAVGVELANPEGVRVILPRQLIDEWAACIVANGFDRSTAPRKIREAVVETSSYSPQLNSFESQLKSAAFASLSRRSEQPSGRRYELVSVGADWTSKESSMGFSDALNGGAYVRTTPIVDLLLRAANDEKTPYFLLLDEMNLSHVERYFADFLSAIESNESIVLHSATSDTEGVPPRAPWPRNLFVVGTVNVDETTYVFSPKVLDRSNTLEFRSTPTALESFLKGNVEVDLRALDSKGQRFARAFAIEASRASLPPVDADRLNAELLMFFRVLSPFGAEFGFRTAREVKRFVHFHSRLAGDSWKIEHALDAQIVQKVLPKLNGSRRRLEPILCALGILCHRARTWDDSLKRITNEPDLVAEARTAASLQDDALHLLLNASEFDDPIFPLSFDKIRRMLERVTMEGFASFAEA